MGDEVGQHVHDARDCEEQVHGAVLPVHEFYPVVLVVQVEVGPIRNKLLCQYPCRETRMEVREGRTTPGSTDGQVTPETGRGGHGPVDPRRCLRCHYFHVSYLPRNLQTHACVVP